MADDVVLPGTGDVIAADQVGGKKFQMVKLAVGGDGEAYPLSPIRALPVAGLRQDADDPVFPDGQAHPFVFGATGRLKVSAQPADIPSVSGNFTAAAQTLVIDCSRASTIVVSMVATVAPTTAHNATFEHSNNSTDGTDGNWYVCQVVRSNANTVETATGVLTATPAYTWEASVNGYRWFRVRTTAQTAGTATYTLRPGAYATEPIPASQITGTQPVSGTITNTPVTPTPLNINSAASTNATAVKTSAGTLYGITVSNMGAAAAFVKLYNKASAPTVGTDVPVLTLPIPAGGVLPNPIGGLGHRFATGIGLAITNLAADTDTTAVAASQVKVLTSFI